jgi:4-hydroxybenzoate polyprenyltransferase
MWLNAALDKDQGEVLFGESCAVPRQATVCGYAALGFAVFGGVWLGLVPGILTALCASLAVAYSHPALRWKAHPVGGPFVNIVGYGLCSPFIGWWTAGVPLNARTLAVLSMVPPFVMGCYLIAQSFQEAEDSMRGYRTLVVTHGPRVTIRVAMVCFHLVFCQFLLLAVIGWLPRTVLALVIPYGVLWRHLTLWARSTEAGAVGRAKLALRGLSAAAVVLWVAMLAHQGLSLAHKGPSAGLNTERGLPEDRLDVRRRALLRMERYAARQPGVRISLRRPLPSDQ